LAFAVAAHLEPEILLVDEVLSVGDLEFQKKCLVKMGKVAEGGRTILFVSHQMHQIRRLCQHVYWMENGGIRSAGATASVVAAYETACSGNADGPGGSEPGKTYTGKARFLRWKILDPQGEHPNQVTTLGPIVFQLLVEVARPVAVSDYGIALYDQDRQLVSLWSLGRIALSPGIHEINYTVPVLPLRPGVYSWYAWMWDDEGFVDRWNGSPELIVATEDYQHPTSHNRGLLNIPLSLDVRKACLLVGGPER
jgi:lipopolysaccharide transport system ATP-binding protein